MLTKKKKKLSNIKMCKLTGKQHLERRCKTSDDLTKTGGTVQVQPRREQKAQVKE